jgi:hypothetical protein
MISKLKMAQTFDASQFPQKGVLTISFISGLCNFVIAMKYIYMYIENREISGKPGKSGKNAENSIKRPTVCWGH